jgi:hypothetical protein
MQFWEEYKDFINWTSIPSIFTIRIILTSKTRADDLTTDKALFRAYNNKIKAICLVLYSYTSGDEVFMYIVPN